VFSLTRRGERALAERRAVWQQFSAAIGGLLAGSRPHGLLKSHDLLK
jgi:DNA-binding PadR family transcriptional regulator